MITEMLGGDEAADLVAALALPAATGLRVRAKDGPVEALLARRGWRGTKLPWTAVGAQLEVRTCHDAPAPDGRQRSAPEHDLLEHGQAWRHPATLHPWQDAGAYYLQDPAAMGVAPVVDAGPGERVLDLAAAPGGKSTYLADMIGRSGLLWSHDVDSRRASTLVSNLERWGVPNAVVSQGPVRVLAPLNGTFDKVLLDAPCSGEGLFRKSLDARRRWSPKRVEEFARLQASLLDAAVELLRPGGMLVYSTCTFNTAENELQIAALLERRHDLTPEAISPGGSSAGLDIVGGPAGLAGACARWWPQRQTGDGHFVARLRRAADSGTVARPPPRHAKRAGRNPAGLGEPATRLETSAVAAFVADALGVAGGVSAEQLVGMRGDVRSYHDQLWLFPQDQDAEPLLSVKRLGAAPRRVGIPLGSARNGHFQPHHALSRVLADDGAAANRLDLSANDPRVGAYLRGEALTAETSDGWLLVRVDGLPLGWAKASRGELNNHYPRGLRRSRAGD